MPSSFANGSNCAVPHIFICFASCNLASIFFTLSASINDLQVIVEDPSYTSKITKNF